MEFNLGFKGLISNTRHTD